MTELEKIAYAKSFIDKLANGINPLDDTPIPEGDIANHVRLSRCFFYVSSILQKEIEREGRKITKAKKATRLPFSITPEQLEQFEYSPMPITVSAMGRKINWLVKEDIEALNQFISKIRNIQKVELLAYHTMAVNKYGKLGIVYRLKGVPPMAKGRLDELKKLVRVPEN